MKQTSLIFLFGQKLVAFIVDEILRRVQISSSFLFLNLVEGLSYLLLLFLLVENGKEVSSLIRGRVNQEVDANYSILEDRGEPTRQEFDMLLLFLGHSGGVIQNRKALLFFFLNQQKCTYTGAFSYLFSGLTSWLVVLLASG